MWIDIIWVLLACFGLWKGWTQGLIISIFTTLAWAIGILAAVKFSSVAAQMMEKEMDFHSNYMPVISFLVVFVVIALLIYIIGKSLEKIIEIAHLGLFNKIAGAILRIAIYTLVFSIFLWLINEAGLITPAVKIQSKTYDLLSRVSNYLVNDFSKFTPTVKNLFDESQQFFEKVSKAAEKQAK